MTPVNRKAGTGERTRELPGETHGIFIVLSGFAATDLSVRFCDACRGAPEPMEKTATPSFLQPFLISADLSIFIREQVTPATPSQRGAQRPVSEEASCHLHFALTPRS